MIRQTRGVQVAYLTTNKAVVGSKKKTWQVPNQSNRIFLLKSKSAKLVPSALVTTNTNPHQSKQITTTINPLPSHAQSHRQTQLWALHLRTRTASDKISEGEHEWHENRASKANKYTENPCLPKQNQHKNSNRELVSKKNSNREPLKKTNRETEARLPTRLPSEVVTEYSYNK